MIHTLTKRHLLPMMTTAAILARISWIHFDSYSSSFFRFGEQLVKKFRPRSVCNALGKTMVMHHPIDGQVFYTDDTKCINDLTAFLMGEVVTSKGDALMHTRNDFTMLLAF